MGGIIMEEMWLARDKNNELFLFVGPKLPEKEGGNQWVSIGDEWVQIDSDLFPEVKWSDKEPTKVKLIIEK